MKPTRSGAAVGAIVCLMAAHSGHSEAAKVRAAVPLEPVQAILDSFRTHDIVALADDHGNEQTHAFRMALIRDPRFPDVVSDIVLEAGNARYQDVVDRYVRGEDVPYADLRRAWQDTTQPTGVWDVPIYEEIYRSARTINASRKSGSKLRVLLGDPPIDWAAVHGREDALAFGRERDRFPAELIQREVLSRGHHALVIYGGTHLLRHPADAPPRSLVDLLEQAHARLFTVWPHTSGTDLVNLDAAAAHWRVPSLVILRDTLLGTVELSHYMGVASTGPAALPISTRLDAIVYLGPISSMTRSHPDAALCSDGEYVKMRKQRIETIQFTFPPDAPFQDWEASFRAECSRS